MIAANQTTINNDLLYQIALTLVPNIGAVQAKVLTEHFGDATSVFKASKKQLSAVENIGEVKAKSIKHFNDFEAAEKEILFIEKYNIQPLFMTNGNYPKRLLNSYDAPVLLYYRGNADLNALRIVNIIGTRSNTEYGRIATEKLITDLKEFSPVIVSGLAFGIDAIAHRAAMQNGLATVGVLGHGLQTIYPAQHKAMAKEMLLNGGLLTEFTAATKPDKHNFPRRNRIVAALADATIIVETAIRGGSMITAELANSYNRDVFAVPGRINDTKSAGCNYLIQSNKAILLTNAKQLAEELGWQMPVVKKRAQRELFIQLTEDEQRIIDILKEKDNVHIDELYLQSGLNSSAAAAAILNLELQNVVLSLPGKIYKLA
jgi:DNA processing protein